MSRRELKLPPSSGDVKGRPITLRLLLKRVEKLKDFIDADQTKPIEYIRNDLEALIDFVDKELEGFRICVHTEDVCEFCSECGEHYLYMGCPAYGLLRRLLARDARDLRQEV